MPVTYHRVGELWSFAYRGFRSVLVFDTRADAEGHCAVLVPRWEALRNPSAPEWIAEATKTPRS